MDFNDSDHPPGLHEVERRLRDERPSFSALELDGVKQDIYARAARHARPSTSRRLSFMRSRMTITAMLVLGVLLSTSGVGLALTGSSDSGTAAGTQYQNPETTTQVIVPPPVTTTPTPPTPTTEVAPQQIQVQTPSSNAPEEKVVPATKSTKTKSAPAQQAPVAQSVEQVAATQASPKGSLPFTGYNAIPILIGGILLLAFGLVMRRQTRRNEL